MPHPLKGALRGPRHDMFNYVMVLASVIIGLGITHLLQGVGGLVQHPGPRKTYWVHLLWVAAVFLRAIFWWWSEFRLSDTAQWTFTLYLFVLAYAVLIYLWCALLFPRDLIRAGAGSSDCSWRGRQSTSPIRC